MIKLMWDGNRKFLSQYNDWGEEKWPRTIHFCYDSPGNACFYKHCWQMLTHRVLFFTFCLHATEMHNASCSGFDAFWRDSYMPFWNLSLQNEHSFSKLNTVCELNWKWKCTNPIELYTGNIFWYQKQFMWTGSFESRGISSECIISFTM